MKSDNNSFRFENAEESTGFLLWQVTNLWQREIKIIKQAVKAVEKFDKDFFDVLGTGTKKINSQLLSLLERVE